jgi:plasmid stabilization system protein ParE
MDFEIIMMDAAYDDLDEAIYYYESQLQSLASRFYRDVLLQFEKLKAKPRYYKFYVEDFRRILLEKFPYLVIYKVIEEQVIIYAIVYSGRDPKTISARIR